MGHFDGKGFKIDGQEYSFDSRGTTADVLRWFCQKNDVRSSNPDNPGKSLRREKKPVLISEIKKKHERFAGGLPDPWIPDIIEEKKQTSMNRFRLANVVFSESLKDDMLKRGQSLAKEDLDVGLKTDQKLFEAVAAEYNKKDVVEYDEP